MNKYKDENALPVYSWCSDIEDGALKQINNLTKLPFAYHHIAIMPDCHQGYGMPIGGVLATERVVIPNAVGVDIGCGMCAARSEFTEMSQDRLKTIMGNIRGTIPVGFFHQEQAQCATRMPDMDTGRVIDAQYNAALKQIGTLGGGNHFIEIQKGSDGYIWVMVHSGSRNIGLKVADHYNKEAKKSNSLWLSSVPAEQDLAFLPVETDFAKDYMKEMAYCVEFAHKNRLLMLDRIVGIIGDGYFEEPIINIAHNYAGWENHFGKDIIIHRKGATLAREGTIGIIPGSQGSHSYIVKGRGNKDSFDSCSHGAGRRMGRKQAQRELSLDEEVAELNNAGVLHSIRGVKDLDEAPGAYKNIQDVMKQQEDLVEVLVELSPLAVVKG